MLSTIANFVKLSEICKNLTKDFNHSFVICFLICIQLIIGKLTRLNIDPVKAQSPHKNYLVGS